MDVVFPACWGIDVHQKSLVACVRIMGPEGRVTQQVRTFGTMTASLVELKTWLADLTVTHGAIESTGVLWKPVWNVLEDAVTLILVNPREVTQVPGRKTDVSEAEWIAQRLQWGLRRGSVVPPRPIREMRDLTRSRTVLEQDRTAIINRLPKVLEDGTVKLGAVVTDMTGVSGRAILRAVIAGTTDVGQLADLARGKRRRKIEPLQQAVEGTIRDHHRFLLQRLLHELEFLESEIALYDARLRAVSGDLATSLAGLDTIPGIDRRTAENVLAEIGPDMRVFPRAAQLVSWAAICPGHHQSAGRQTHGTMRKGHRWLRRALTQAAWASTRKKNSYPREQYYRLARRRGKHRAILAVAHTLLVAAYHILRDGVDYRDLGPDHFNRLAPAKLTRDLVRRLEHLGHKVVLEPAA